jgi:hypothetical protein
MLSDDILVDHIFDYLMVEDILCLRMVMSTLHLPIATKLFASGQQIVLQPYAPWYNMETVSAKDRTQCAYVTAFSAVFSSFIDLVRGRTISYSRYYSPQELDLAKSACRFLPSRAGT